MWNTCLLFVLPTLLCLSRLSESITVFGGRNKGRELFNRNSVKLERGIIEKRVKHKGYIAQQGFNNGTVALHLSDETGVNKNEKRVKHKGYIAQQGFNNGTIKLHLSDETGVNKNANRLENDGSFIVQRSYNDGSNTLHMEDESGGANEFSFGPNTGEKGTVSQEGTNKGEVEETITKRDPQMAKRLNDPSDSYLFRINNGTIGQQGENMGTIALKGKPKEGTIVQQGLNKGTLAFTDKGPGKRTFGTKDKFTFLGNNGTIAQQGQSGGTIELKLGDESGKDGYAKRQSTPDEFKFAANNGSIAQEGKNLGEVTETITRDFHPNDRLNDPKDYKFKPNNRTIIQQGLNKGTIKLQGKPYVGNIPQEGKNEGKIMYNGKEVKPRDEPTEGKFSFAGTSGAVIDQKGTNTGNIKDQGHK